MLETFEAVEKDRLENDDGILKDTKEPRPCEPREMFDCLKTFFTILKVVGVYFESTRDLEKIRSMTAKKSFTLDEGDSTNCKNAVVNDTGLDLQDSGRTKRRTIVGKIHRVYCTALLVFHWANVLRMLSMFTKDDTFGSELFVKIIIIDYMTMCAGMVTALHWACASGKFVTVMISLAGLRGVDANYLRKLDRNTCLLCGGAFLMNIGFMIFGIFKLGWLYQPVGTPINTWILTNNEDVQLVTKMGIIVVVVIVLSACFFISSVGMVLCLMIRRCIVRIERDLKSSMALVQSIEAKTQSGCSFVGKSHPVEEGNLTTKKRDGRQLRVSSLGKLNPYFFNTSLRDKKLKSEDYLIIEDLRHRFQFITKVIKKADSFTCVSNACGICGYLLLMVFALYILLWYSCRYKDEWAYLVTLSLWFLNAVMSLAYMSFSPVLVNNAAQKVLERLHDVDLSQHPSDILNLFNIFLTRMSTDNIGFSVLHLFVIDRNTLMTIVGLFITYFLMIYQFNPDDGSYCSPAKYSTVGHI